VKDEKMDYKMVQLKVDKMVQLLESNKVVMMAEMMVVKTVDSKVDQTAVK